MSKQENASKYRPYSPSKIAAAVSMVQSGALSKRKASLTYGIPRTTLIDKLSGKAPIGINPGKPCVLTKAEEMVLVDYTKNMASIGSPLKPNDLFVEVKKVLYADRRPTPFKNNLPGKHWYQGFVKRHPDITLRRAMELGHQRALISKEMVDGWFDGLKTYLQKEVPDWEAMINDPRRIFNADESGFPLSITNGKVLTDKGVRHVYQVCTSNKTQITVLACFNAIGNYIPPLIVYPGERFRDSGIHEFDEAIYGHTSSGWMDSELFVSYLEHFNEFVSKHRIPKPVMLLVDGHSTHMSLAAAYYCFTNDIILYCLLANATHILQPCDVGFFSPMKAAWKKEVKSWQLANLGQALTKKHFPGVFRKAWERVAKLENAAHGFLKCGIFPLDPRNIDTSKLNPSKAIIREDNVERGCNETDQSQKACAEQSQNTAETQNIPESTADEPETETPNAEPTPTAVEVSEPTEHSRSNDTRVLDKPQSDVTQTTHITKAREEVVSPAFKLLKVPEVKRKKTNTVRQRLPKSLSGKEALRILQEKEDKKKSDEEAKNQRKVLRMEKKLQKLEEKEKKSKLRQEAKKRREEERLLKAASKGSKRKRRESSSDDSESECDETPRLMDSEEDTNEERSCPGCGSDEGDDEEWIRCVACRQRWHITCTGDAVLFEIPADQVPNYPFHCEYCV